MWLEEWCPECGAAPGARCRRSRLFGRPPPPVPFLHVARGWRGRSCPACRAEPGERCRTPSGREASRTHAARLRCGRDELVGGWAVWEELARRGATAALVGLGGRAGRGGQTTAVALCRQEGGELVEVERTFGRDELRYALEGPVWARLGTFVGHPSIHGTVSWLVTERRVIISGKRGGRSFEETVR